MIIAICLLEPSKGQSGRKSKASAAKTEEPSEAADDNESSPVADKAFDFKSDDEESSADEAPARKNASVKIKLKKQTSNDTDTPPAKRRYVRKSAAPSEGTTVFGQTANGSSVSYQQRTTTTTDTPAVNGNSPGKKRGRPPLSKPSVVTNSGDNESTTTPKKPITKPKAFMDKVNDGMFCGREKM